MIATRIKERLQGGLPVADGLRDLVFIGGAVAIVFGVSLLSVPAAWVVGGAGLMYLAFASAPPTEEPVEIEQPEVPRSAADVRRAA